jgi:hypothetical protein
MARYSVDYDGDLSTTDDRQSYRSFDAAVGAIGDRGFDSYSVQDNRRGGGGNLGSFGVGSDDGFAALNAARPVNNGLLGGFFSPGRMIGGALGGLALGPIGGILGGIIGNQMGRGRYGYTDAQGNRVSAARDMFDGGPFSGALNAVGVRPAGYRARQEAAGPDMDMAEAMAAPAMTGTTPATTAVMPPAPTIPTAPYTGGMYVSDYMSMRSPSMNPAFAGSGMTPATNYVPMRDPTSPTTGVMPADLAPAYDPRLTPEMQRAMRSMPATGQAPTTTGQARPTAADQMTAMSERAMDPMERAPMVPPSIRQDLSNYFRGVLRGTLGGVMGGPAAGLLPGETLNRLPAETFSQQSVTQPSAPSTMASPFGTRALTPYEQMQARARAAGGGITYTQPGSLRPVGVLP